MKSHRLLFLLQFLVSALVLIPLTALTAESPWVKDQHPDLCQSTQEYKKAMTFLRNQPEFKGNEGAAREIAGKISTHCTKAFDRFSKTFLLLRKSGVNSYKSVEIATEFAGETNETIDNFYEIFQKTYLAEQFNLEFSTALEIAYALSKNYAGDPTQARKDFTDLTKFCLAEENLALGLGNCAKFAVELAKLSQYFPGGTYEPFKEVYEVLRKNESFGVSIQKATNIIAEVFRYGPEAPKNFLTAFEYGMDAKGLGLTPQAALIFGHQMAERSTKTMPPPVYVKPGETSDPKMTSESKAKDKREDADSNEESNEG